MDVIEEADAISTYSNVNCLASKYPIYINNIKQLIIYVLHLESPGTNRHGKYVI